MRRQLIDFIFSPYRRQMLAVLLLLRYCKYDTEAMVAVVRFVEGAQPSAGLAYLVGRQDLFNRYSEGKEDVKVLLAYFLL